MADSSSLKASNILVPLTNDDRIISDKSPLKTNYPTTTNIFLLVRDLMKRSAFRTCNQSQNKKKIESDETGDDWVKLLLRINLIFLILEKIELLLRGEAYSSYE